MIRYGLRQVIKEPTIIYAEDLTSPIKSKHQSKLINRRLNNWMKGELQVSLEEIGKETGSTVKTVNGTLARICAKIKRKLYNASVLG